MSPKIVVPPNHSILMGFSIINHPFWDTPSFGNTHIYLIISTYIRIEYTYINSWTPKPHVENLARQVQRSYVIIAPGMEGHLMCHWDVSNKKNTEWMGSGWMDRWMYSDLP